MRQLLVGICMLLTVGSFAQEPTNSDDSPDTLIQNGSKPVVIVLYNGGVFQGTIIKEDSKEVLIRDFERGEVTIPKYEIKSTETLTEDNFHNGKVIDEDYYVHRNIFSHTAFQQQDDVVINLYYYVAGDAQLRINENFSCGIMTSLYATPMYANLKYSKEIKDGFHLSGMIKAGYITLIDPGVFSEYAFFSPSIIFTRGTQRNNFSLSVNYAGNFSGEVKIPLAGFSLNRMVGERWTLAIDGMAGTFMVANQVYNESYGGFLAGVKYRTRRECIYSLSFPVAFGKGIGWNRSDVLFIPLPMLTFLSPL